MATRRKLLYAMAGGAGISLASILTGWSLHNTDDKEEYNFEPGMKVKLEPNEEVRGPDWGVLNKGLENGEYKLRLGENATHEMNGTRFYEDQQEIGVEEDGSYNPDDYGMDIPGFEVYDTGKIDSIGLEFAD